MSNDARRVAAMLIDLAPRAPPPHTPELFKSVKNLTRYNYDGARIMLRIYLNYKLNTPDSFSAERINNLILCKMMIPHLAAASDLDIDP